jgi:WD40 repeat protein
LPESFLGLEVQAVTFSEDGLLFATARRGVRATVWHFDPDTRAITEGVTVIGHDEVRGLAFDADSETLVVSHADSTLRFWDLAAPPSGLGSSVAGHRFPPSAFYWSPGANRLVAYDDVSAAAWNLDWESMSERMCSVATRTLTDEEWDTYVGSDEFPPACVR